MNLISGPRNTQTRYSPGGSGTLPGSQSVDGGVSSLAQNDTSKAVTFAVGFTSAPAVQGVIILPNGSSVAIACWPDESTRTTTGVTFLFGDAIPASGYKLSWSAIGS